MTSRIRSSSRPVALALALALASSLLALLAACGTDETAAPRAAAQAFARAAQAGDVGRIDFTEPAGAAAYRASLAPLAGARSTVQVGSVTRTGNSARAALSWTTTIGSGRWHHDGTLDLRLVSGRWRVAWAPTAFEGSLRAGEKLTVTRTAAPRGRILGRGGIALVEPRPVVRFGIDKAQVPATTVATSAGRLAALLGITAAPYLKAVAAAGPKAFVPALVLRTSDVSAALRRQVGAIPGARGLDDQLPLAPTREFEAAILGTVGPVTAEIVKASQGRLQAGDVAGLSGLELRYDARLGGTPGVLVQAGPSTAPRTLFQVAAVPGQDLRTTLDLRLAGLAQRLLASYGPASALVALQPSTGAILAAASGPGSNGYNTATFGRYAPGSTFKVISALALLRSGLSVDSPVSCTPTLDVNGKVFKNYSDYPAAHLGRISLLTAVANSCNTGFISQRARLHGSDLADAAASLGFGVDHDLGFPAYFGQVPPAASLTEAAADMIGQGKILASPLAMATVVASVAKGATVLPVLLPGLTARSAPAAGPLTPAEVKALRTLLHAVVEQGSGAGLAPLQPPTIYAKTGTAEYGDTPPLPTHAWMIAAQGDLAVAVFVDTGESGSRTAGPVLADFLRAARR